MLTRRKILIMMLIMLVSQTYIYIGITEVSGISMLGSLTPNSKHIYIDKKMKKIKRFDLVIIDSYTLDEKIIKRVIGLPNERLSFKSGELYVNDKLVEQNFDYKKSEVPFNFNVKLGEDEYFLLGDNRDNSIDSRAIGPIKEEEIEKVLINKNL